MQMDQTSEADVKEFYDSYLTNETSATTASSEGEMNATVLINTDRTRRGKGEDDDEAD